MFPIQSMRAAMMMAAVGAVLAAMPARADDYPSRTVEAIHQFGPGGGTDRFIRAIGEPFQEITGQALVPISVQGGGGVPAAVTFMQRPSDGYSMMAVGPEQVINHVLGRMNIDELRPIARIQYDQGLFLVSKDSPIKSVDDLIKTARENPGSLKVAVTGTAGFDDTLVGLWNIKSGAELTTVPFSASEMVSNTLGGHVDLMYEEYGPARGLIESGDLRPLVLFSEFRLPVLGDVPTATELGFDVSLGRWRGFAMHASDDEANANTMFSILDRAAVSESYKTIETQSGLQFRSKVLGPTQFKEFMEHEVEIYTDVLKQLGYVE
ncbi:Bug family tripartite tricarboxylate transporter substrate binding protein [Roseibium aggregatum]|uniref:Bug family tripartite tricarboxylate transporter substrate binding protein n=1 Tax=Roseibium aggregatum TaxID=187304 RepID=UPI003A97DCB7